MAEYDPKQRKLGEMVGFQLFLSQKIRGLNHTSHMTVWQNRPEDL